MAGEQKKKKYDYPLVNSTAQALIDSKAKAGQTGYVQNPLMNKVAYDMLSKPSTKTTTTSASSTKVANTTPSIVTGEMKSNLPTLTQVDLNDGHIGNVKDVGSDKDKNNGGDGGDYGTYARAYANFVPSQTYVKAMEYTQSLLDQLSSGRTSYTDKVQEMLGKIESKDPFTYDPNTDMLFQNALAGAMNAGQIAMQDTMGQAAALTGGYGSSYAQAVGNQAYNDYIQDAYNDLPSYYGLARDAYDKDVQEMYNMLDMYNTQDQLEYDRLANAYGLNAQAAALLYDQEYNNYWQTQNFNEDSRRWAAEMGLKAQQYKDSKDQWQQEYDLAVDKANASSEKEYDPSNLNIDSKVYEAAWNYYINGGDEEGSDYETFIMQFPEPVANAIDSYVQSKSRPTSIRLVNKYKSGDSDDVYVDEYNRTWTYSDLLKLFNVDQIKAMTKK